MKAAPIAALLACTLLGPACAKPLTVAWRDKAPYHYVDNGVEKGILIERARKIFATAGLETRFVREPAKRIWANFQSGSSAYCSFGWYRLPEREAFSQFSQPIHVDPPHTVLVAPEAVAAVGAHTTLASLLADRKLTIGTVDGVSYGPELDALIKAGANQVLRRTDEPSAMMRMIAADRGSFMLVDRDDLDYYREQEPTLAHAIQRDFPDMPAGLSRHILCSKDVSAETMVRINKAIDIVWKTPQRPPYKK